MRWQRLITLAAEKLAACQIPSPQVDARLLAQYLLGTDQLGLLTAPEPAPEQIADYADLIARRAKYEPVQLIMGWAPFRGLKIEVGEGVFIPRPETELVAQAGLDALAKLDRPGKVAELCAGSGAISAAILAERPGVKLWAVEKYEAAAGWTRRTVEPRGGQVVVADMAAALAEHNASFDLVIANPPYIPESDLNELPVEVVDHDPHTALFSPDDGFADIAVVIKTARRLLKPGGYVVIEHGDDQQPRVLAMLAAAGFSETNGEADLAGRPRYVTGRLVPVLGE